MTDVGPSECRPENWGLMRVKRDWVPDWLWRVFCVGNLATFTPWKELLTAKPQLPNRSRTEA